MTRRTALAGLIGALDDAGVAIKPSIFDGGLKDTAKQLNDVEFSVQSPCGDVKIWIDANGALREVIIADGALKRHDSGQMGALIRQTITTAEQMIVDAVGELARRQLKRAAL